MITAISKTGPFFSRDPVKTFRANVRDLMDTVADIGEADVKAQLKAGEGARAPLRGISPARVSGHVIGRTSNLAGKRWQSTAIVQVANRGLSDRQAVSLMAAASLLEGRGHPFRRTMGRMARQRKVIMADLLKGLQ